MGGEKQRRMNPHWYSRNRLSIKMLQCGPAGNRADWTEPDNDPTTPQPIRALRRPARYLLLCSRHAPHVLPAANWGTIVTGDPRR